MWVPLIRMCRHMGNARVSWWRWWIWVGLVQPVAISIDGRCGFMLSFMFRFAQILRAMCYVHQLYLKAYCERCVASLQLTARRFITKYWLLRFSIENKKKCFDLTINTRDETPRPAPARPSRSLTSSVTDMLSEITLILNVIWEMAQKLSCHVFNKIPRVVSIKDLFS